MSEIQSAYGEQGVIWPSLVVFSVVGFVFLVKGQGERFDLSERSKAFTIDAEWNTEVHISSKHIEAL